MMTTDDLHGVSDYLDGDLFDDLVFFSVVMVTRGKHILFLSELTSELADHVVVLLKGVLQDFLSGVHLPAPLSAHRVGVMSVRGRYQIIRFSPLQLLHLIILLHD